MRTWVEKLAKNISERGVLRGGIFLDNLDIRLNCFHHYPDKREFNIEITELDDEGKVINCNSCIKLYEDEYDILDKALETIRKKSEDYFINLLNNLG
jgi:hypothetical protein